MDDEERCVEHEHNFHKILYQMSYMVETLYADYKKRVANKEKNKKVKEEDNDSVNHGSGGYPLEPPSPYSISISSPSSSHSHHSQPSSFHPCTSKNPLLKLDVKFNFPMFNGEATENKLNNWIRQIKVYCHVQHIEEEEENIQLDSLRMEGTTLVWWERKLHKGSKNTGILLSSWSEFTSALKKQFYPLVYVQKSIMKWKNLRQGKGQSVQSFTKEFRKEALALNIRLDSHETLMKYIGALHNYI
jgi:hypothetical protein